MNIKTLADGLGAAVAGCGETQFEYICTDSREADSKTLFVALRGEKVDGHNYLSAAAALGCSAFLVESTDRLPSGASAVVCDNCEKALILAAQKFGRRENRLTVAVTGSVGKTTTKEFIASVLGTAYMTHKTFGNFNSTIGMPLTLLEAPDCSDAVVLEMAMSGRGEISAMSSAAVPDISVITNIGTAHMEMLGSRQNILFAKSEITDGMLDGSTLIINSDNDMLSCFTADRNINTVKIAIHDKSAHFYAENIRYEDGYTYFDIKTPSGIFTDIKIPAIGEHNVYAGLIAAAVGVIIDMNEADIRRGLASYTGVSLRQQIYGLGGVTVIEDCYNASPESMRAALDVLNMLGRKNKARTVALLGDMRELGDTTAELHRDIGKYAATCRVDMLFTIGGLADNIADGAALAGISADRISINPDEEAYSAIAEKLFEVLAPGDILLVKASRAIRAERVIEKLKELTENK